MLAAALLLAATGATLEARVDTYVKPLVESKDFRGVVLIAKGEYPLLEKAYGVPKEGRFRVASITKTFTGAAIALLAERGKLSLDDRLAKYAPTFPSADKISLRHLLLHQSGVGNPEISPCSNATLADLVADLAKKPLQFEPGADSSYSNGGYALLAHVIEQVTGKKWEDALRDEIFKPLALNATQRDREGNLAKRVTGSIPGPGPTGLVDAPCQNAAAAIGSGALLSTAADLHKWAYAVNHDKLFQRSKLEHPYGWGIRTYHDRIAIEQSGILNGFSSYVSSYLDDDIHVVVLANIQTGALTELGIGLAGLAFNKEVAPVKPSPATIATTADQRKPWLGRYGNGKWTFTLSERDGALYHVWEGATNGSYVFPTGASTAFNRQERATMTLGTDGITIAWGGSEGELFRKQ